MQKGFVAIFIIVGILLFSGIVGGVYVYKTRSEKSKVFHDEYGMPILIPSKSPEPNNKPIPDTKPQDDQTAIPTNMEGKACGGFAGEKGDRACPEGYYCKYPKPVYPDAAGKCVKR